METRATITIRDQFRALDSTDFMEHLEEVETHIRQLLGDLVFDLDVELGQDDQCAHDAMKAAEAATARADEAQLSRDYEAEKF